MIWLTPLVWAADPAVTSQVDLRVGARTQPEAALEQPAEWEPTEELEPAAIGILSAQVGNTPERGPWWQVSGSAWGLAPESETSLLTLTPQAGTGTSLGGWRSDVAARADLQLYPVEESDPSSLRGEVLASLQRPDDRWVPWLGIEGIGRVYPLQPTWSFQSVEPRAELIYRRDAGWVRGRAGAQANQHQGAVGTQVRAGLSAGLTGARAELWGGYGLIAAQAGTDATTARPPFTPIGDYAADADALSAGGFLQHRLDLGTSMFLGDWTLRASGLVRLRDSFTADPTSFARTGHGQLDLERPLGGVWVGVATLGVSGAALEGGAGYTDTYGWVGISWRPN